MTKQTQYPQQTTPKRLSPELAEVLHMLKSLETAGRSQTPAPLSK